MSYIIKSTSPFVSIKLTEKGSKYNYSLVKYNGSFKKIKIICPIHGEFEQSSDKHIRGHGCLLCKESKGEREIRVYLKNRKINFSQQYIFNSCRVSHKENIKNKLNENLCHI
jgi:antitoxin component YwqK of YwqJK toxin-antitoxin module